MFAELACLILAGIIAIELKFIFWIISRKAENERMKAKVMEAFGSEKLC